MGGGAMMDGRAGLQILNFIIFSMHIIVNGL